MGRPRKIKYQLKETWQIYNMLRFFLDAHGIIALDYLTGRSPFPATQEIAELKAAVDASKSDDIGTLISKSRRFVYEAQAAIETTENIQRLIVRTGGAKRIVEVFLWYKAECPENFAVLEELCQVGRPGKKPTVEALAADRHVSPRTLYRTRDFILEQISRELSRRGRILVRQCV